MIRITDLNAPEVRMYTGLNEKQVKRIFEPDEGAFICESARVISRAIDAGYEPLSFFIEDGMENDIPAASTESDIPFYIASHEVLKNITGYSLTGGVLSAMRRKAPADAREFIKTHTKLVILDDVENPTNVGAIFRSAAALGADGVLLTKGSADPLYRRAARVSMGTVFQIDWTYAVDDLMQILRDCGFETFALALSDDAVSLRDCTVSTKKTAVILGNEDHGISDKLLSDCDHVVMIPMENGVDSLNVAAASAVAFWGLFK